MRSLLYIFLAISVFISCKNDSDTIKPELLYGQWRFHKVLRNGKPTSTLDKGYMIFENNGYMESNIFQNGFFQQYTLKDADLNILGDDAMQLKITRLTQDTCIMKGKVWLFDMEFYMHRVKETIMPDQQQ